MNNPLKEKIIEIERKVKKVNVDAKYFENMEDSILQIWIWIIYET